MASGYNRIIIMGNLTRDPELKQLGSSQSVCRLGLASNRQYKNRQNGEMVQEVLYIDVDVWGPQADTCKQFLEKGRPVLIEGRLKLDSWQDTDGKQRSKHSIVADRVVFLTQTGEGAVRSKDEELSPLEPRNDVERDLMSQLDSIKAKIQPTAPRKTTASQEAPSWEAARAPRTQSTESRALNNESAASMFKDEPPFQDDLPF